MDGREGPIPRGADEGRGEAVHGARCTRSCERARRSEFARSLFPRGLLWAVGRDGTLAAAVRVLARTVQFMAVVAVTGGARPSSVIVLVRVLDVPVRRHKD